MKKHACRTYFAIYGAKDAAALLGELGLDKAQVRCNDSIMIGFNDDYNVDINQMFRVTLQSLFDKTALLSELKEKYSLEYYLVGVPEIVSESDDPHQILGVNEEIVAFLYASKTKLDLDYYVY